MDAAPLRSLWRYFVPADSFVRILVREPGQRPLRVQPGLNRAAYRRLVIETCCPEYRGEVAGRLAELCPEDPLAAEDLLYQLCVEVNPHLDIHTVRLPAEPEPAPGAAPQRARSSGEPTWRARLAERSNGLAARLQRHVIGQSEAIERVSRCVRKAAAGLAEDRRPLASLFFLGRTGTGKTELARALARELFARDDAQPHAALVRIDCSEYALAHEYAKLIGAPPGYIGHDQGGILTDAVRKRPDCVVLFDEIEKAHPRLHNLLLSILDEGRLTDSRGQVADFTRALVVLTSNVGAGELLAASRRVGFERTPRVDAATAAEIAQRALEGTFSPEFLGRLDERVLFRDLEREDARAIAKLLLERLCLRARQRGLRVACSPAVARWVAERGHHPDSGARELRRVIERELEAPLAELMLGGQVARRALVRATIKRGALVLESEG